MNVNWLFTAIDMITSPIRRIFQLISQVVPGVKRIAGFPPPKLIAVLVFVFLLIVYVAAIISHWRSTQEAERPWQIWLGLFLLVCLIPLITYFLVKFLLLKEESRFPNIDQIWEQALQQCAQHNISLRGVPIFLVVGGKDAAAIHSLLKAAQVTLNVAIPTQRNADIGFFGNREMVFISVNGASYTSGLATAAIAGPEAASSQQRRPMQSAAAFDATMNPNQYLQSMNSTPIEATTDLGGRAELGGTLAGDKAISPGFENVEKTMVLPEGQLPADLAEFSQLMTGANSGGSFSAMLSSQEIFDRDQKLRYVSQLICKARSSLCPINGILTLLPFDLVEKASGQLQTALQKDLQALRESLLLRCPQVVLVADLDSDEGFQELIKRVGERECRDTRFGRGSDLWNAPSADRLDAIAAHAAGAFEDWIYVLFQRENALQQRYNSRLLGLLCRVRGRFAENLRKILAKGCGFDPNLDPDQGKTQFLFSGCYFAGLDPKRPAFLKSVVAKLIQQEGELEWSPVARFYDRQYQFLANLFALLGGLSLIAMVMMIAWSFSR